MSRFTLEPASDVYWGVGASAVLHNMSVPPRTTINYRSRPVYEATLVSFRHWLLFRKFVDSELPRNKELKKLFHISCLMWFSYLFLSHMFLYLRIK